MTAEPIRVSPVWLACREAADAAARATDLALLVNHHLADRPAKADAHTGAADREWVDSFAERDARLHEFAHCNAREIRFQSLLATITLLKSN